jgi:hypothetical protein
MAIEAIRQRFMAGDLDQAIAMTTAVIQRATADQDAPTLASVLVLRSSSSCAAAYQRRPSTSLRARAQEF